MVNKCSVVGCKSLYSKDKVKLHRFPLTNLKVLPFWIAITGKESEWKPTKSSRLCCNHFIKSDYMLSHKKGLLKPIAVPSIYNRENVPRYRKNKNIKLYPKFNNFINQINDINKLIQEEYVEEYVEENMVPEHETRFDQTASYRGNDHVNIQNNQNTTINIKRYGSSNIDDNKYHKKNENSDNEIIQYESGYNSGYQNKNGVNNTTIQVQSIPILIITLL